MADIAAPDGTRTSDPTPDVERGCCAITMACELTGSEAADKDRSAHIVLSGESGTYGGGDCPCSPITYFGTPDGPTPETFNAEVLADGQELYRGLSASPATAPEQLLPMRRHNPHCGTRCVEDG